MKRLLACGILLSLLLIGREAGAVGEAVPGGVVTGTFSIDDTLGSENYAVIQDPVTGAITVVNIGRSGPK
jgi:hypothetical protein